jgi:hypothetical protein
MSDKIDLKKMEQRANRLLSQDGLVEILLGAVFFVASASFSEKGSYIPFLPLYVIFMKQIVESFRNRFTYPRIGYVKVPDDESDVGKGILVFLGAVLVLLVLGVYIGYRALSSSALYQWLPLGIGMFLTGALKYSFDKTGDRINLLYIAVSVLGGVVFSLMSFPVTRDGPQMYLLFISLFFFIAGLVRFSMFTRNNPVLEVPQDE